jgi:UPF0176 protein
MTIINIAGYQFLALTELSRLRQTFIEKCEALALKGTILLSEEGININLAGKPKDIALWKQFLREDSRFAQLSFRESCSTYQPYKFMRIKIKKEIITMGKPEIQPGKKRAPAVSPHEFKQWLDQGRDITVLDTRNEYEVRFGTFEKATHFHLQDFSEFPKASENLNKDKPVVMFCTGGIRCEKAGLHLLNAGFPEVYQLEGGILNYFKEVGGAHYQGECFVFDQRVALDATLQESGTVQCTNCNGPVSKQQQAQVEYVPNVSCPHCFTLT